MGGVARTEPLDQGNDTGGVLCVLLGDEILDVVGQELGLKEEEEVSDVTTFLFIFNVTSLSHILHL